MTNEEIEIEIRKRLESQDIFKLEKVDDVNHRPHMFMIGSKHVAHSSDHHGGALGEATLAKIPCAHPGCGLMYNQHISDKVVFLSLLRNANDEESRDVLTQVVTASNTLKGVVFVETEQKYRITEKDPA